MTTPAARSNLQDSNRLLDSLKKAYENYSYESKFYELGKQICDDANHLIYNYFQAIEYPNVPPAAKRYGLKPRYVGKVSKTKIINSADEEKLQPILSNVIKVLNDPTDHQAIQDLQTDINKTYPKTWKRFLGAIVILASVAILALGIASIFFTGGSSLMVASAIVVTLSICTTGSGIYLHDKHNSSFKKNLDKFAHLARTTFFENVCAKQAKSEINLNAEQIPETTAARQYKSL